ncbi:4-hydroxytryptamine kinase-like protein [Cladobotryum mycophilum]|uniref:non-specific serine/threonine protein kinase n=1 Tax=Cladobotryum mycophilum TaxID=491253 RepID=A0ABR0T4D0_9HYPO
METIKETQNDPVATQILYALSSTEYACSSLSRLSGGILNFVYRGTLSRTLPDGATTVIIKHAEERMPGLEGFSLSTHRSFFETQVLRAVHGRVTELGYNGIDVIVPRVYRFNAEHSTQLLEDFKGQTTMREFLQSQCSQSISSEFVTRLGTSLGSWLGALHVWGEGKSPTDLTGEEQENCEVQDASFNFYYDNPLRKIDQFPHLLGSSRETFERVKQRAAEDLKNRDATKFGIIHGDVSTKNILISDDPSTRDTHPRFIIIDWELSQYNSQLRDCGQVLSDLYMLQYLGSLDAAKMMTQGFMQGYPSLTEGAIFQTAIHVGLFLLLWDVTLPGSYSTQEVEGLIILARDLVVAGWNQDREGLKKTTFGTVFSSL